MPEEKDYDSMSVEELEAESRKNPVEKTLPEPDPAGEGQAETPAKQRQAETVPYERFSEENQRRQKAEAQLQYYHNIAIQSQLNATQQSRPPAPTKQEIADYQANMELLQPYLAPFQQQLVALQNQVVGYEADKLVNQAEHYVRSHVKDFDALAPEIFQEINKMSSIMQDKISHDPDWVISIAEIVRLRKNAGTQTNETTVKQDLKKRAVSESRGSDNPAPRQTTSKIDPEYERVILHGTPQELTAYERKMRIR